MPNLDDSSLTLQEVLDGVGAAITSFWLYPNQQIEYLFYSAGCEPLYGYPSAELKANSMLWRSHVHPDDWHRVLIPAFAELIEQSTSKVEYRFQRPNGCWVWVAETATARWDESRQCWIVITVATEISDRKQVEAERGQAIALLYEQAQRLQLCLELNEIGCWDWYIDANQLIWDEPCFRVLGVPLDTPVSFHLWQGLIYPEDFPTVEQCLADALANSTDYYVEYRVIHPDGRVHWHASFGRTVDREKSTTTRMIGLVMDITERKQAEVERQRLYQEREQTLAILREREEQLRLTLQLSRIGSWDWNIATNTVQWSDQHFSLLGLVPGEVEASYQVWRDRVHPDDIGQVEHTLAIALANQTDFRAEYRVIRSDGNLRWMAGMGSSIFDANGNPTRLIGVIIDISDRKHTELTLQQINADLNQRVQERTQELLASQAILQEQEQEIRALLENSPDVISRIDQDLRFIFINRVIEEITGLHPNTFLHKTLAQLNFPAEIVKEWSRVTRQVFASATAASLEIAYPTPQGNRQYQVKLVPEFDSQHQVVTVLAIARDITELKAAEAALRRSEEKFRKVFETSPIAIGLTNLDTLRFIQVNPAYCQMLGYSEAEMLALSFTDFTDASDLQTNLDYLQLLLAGTIPSFQLDKHYIRNDGSPIWVSVTVALLPDSTDGINYGVAMVEDITKRKQAETSLRTSLQEKEVLLKEVHHRVKNNLQIVSSLLRMQSRAVSDSTTATLFQDAQNRVQSMAFIHEHLYRSPSLSCVDFEEYIRVLLNHLFRSYGVNSRQIASSIQVEAADLTLDLAIPFGLIINELVSNSLKHAFPDGRSGNVTICLLASEKSAVPSQNLGTLLVQDDGIGISPKVDWRTTSSLGLRIVRNLVEQMRGVLTVECDRGTVFRIAFPHPPH